MVDRIFLKQLTWNDLFARHSFFTHDYKYYLSITASSQTKEAQSLWSGLVESKLRHLVGALDRKGTIGVSHPFPKGFERVHTVADDQQAEAVKGGSTKYQVQKTKSEPLDETNAAANIAAVQQEGTQSDEKADDEGSRTIYTTTYYIGLEIKPLQPGMQTERFTLFG